MEDSFRANPYCEGQLTILARVIHDIARSKGWWDEERNVGECIALIHSELSEALEALRNNPNCRDMQCPAFNQVEVEMADAVIRIFDLCAAKGWDIGGAIVAKMRYNESRPYKHGGKAF